MNEEFWRWYMYGHWICLAQWLGFIMVEYACLLYTSDAADEL